MKKILLIVLVLSLTIPVQAISGENTRKKMNLTTPAPAKKKLQGSAVGKNENSGKRSAASVCYSEKTNMDLTQTQKDSIIQSMMANMVYVEGGTFVMGATDELGNDAYDWEKPTHQVTLSSFSINKYEVTQEEWQVVMGNNPSWFKGAKRPVEKVSWEECQEFILKLNAMTGRHFRLPTEAEWEYAARGGNKSHGYKYAGSNDLKSVGWYDFNCRNETHNVGSKQPNELGLYDMSGNVWEWCQDWYDEYSPSVQTNPTGSSSGVFRVFRGGSWINKSRNCRVSERRKYYPDGLGGLLGFRLAQ
ncbi:MAG: formylglycine-generating enzyme family protein [Fibrobacter sp.]|nr:formylglycine-generating enzyme family protein [Fibrobacter sp.]